MSVTTATRFGVQDGHALIRVDPAIPASVPAIRRAIADFAYRSGAGADQVESVRLAVSEATTNVVVHAYRGALGRVYTSAWRTPGRLVILVGDDGCGLRSDSASPGLGLGLALIERVSDGFELVERSTGGTEVRIDFELLEE